MRDALTNLDKLVILPRPIQEPYPPLYVAAVILQSYKWAGRESHSTL
jgi:hypothetical protein